MKVSLYHKKEEGRKASNNDIYYLCMFPDILKCYLNKLEEYLHGFYEAPGASQCMNQRHKLLKVRKRFLE